MTENKTFVMPHATSFKRGQRPCLDWGLVDEIGQLLATRHKDENPYMLSYPRLNALVLNLPKFCGAATPPTPLYFDLILSAWQENLRQ